MKEVDINLLVKDYIELKSSYKVAKKHDITATVAKRLLKEARVLRTQSEAAKARETSNLKHLRGERRPRDFKVHEFTPVRNRVFNRDSHTCYYCRQVGGHLHAHHILPYWVAPSGFLDDENLITVCTDCHFSEAHKGNWIKFDITPVTDYLLDKYSLNRERLNELAGLKSLKR